MLAPLDPDAFERIEFPLGEMTKAETRAEAAAAGLEVAERRESQEACFLAGDDYRAFLERQGVEAGEGAIVDEQGTELGRHGGVWRFTPGQRRGIGVAAAEPLYALRADAATNILVVGPRGSLATTTVEADGVLHVPADRVEAKLRYRSPALPARVTSTEDGFSLRLEQPAYGVAPGQIAALYDGGAVVGYGVVTSSGRD
jgi:tRNA-specific 2-thiouridylase